MHGFLAGHNKEKKYTQNIYNKFTMQKKITPPENKNGPHYVGIMYSVIFIKNLWTKLANKDDEAEAGNELIFKNGTFCSYLFS